MWKRKYIKIPRHHSALKAKCPSLRQICWPLSRTLSVTFWTNWAPDNATTPFKPADVSTCLFLHFATLLVLQVKPPRPPQHCQTWHPEDLEFLATTAPRHLSGTWALKPYCALMWGISAPALGSHAWAPCRGTIMTPFNICILWEWPNNDCLSEISL